MTPKDAFEKQTQSQIPEVDLPPTSTEATAYTPPGVGKFSGSQLAEFLWALTMIQGQDDEVGSSTEGDGWHGLFNRPFEATEAERLAKEHGIVLTSETLETLTTSAGFIVTENSDGSVGVDTYSQHKEMMYNWKILLLDGTDDGDVPWIAGDPE